MPLKYWAKIEGGVEGPYVPEALKFIDGFSQDTLVSPDSADSEEIWTKVSEVKELQALLNKSARTGAVPKVIEAPAQAPEETDALPLNEPVGKTEGEAAAEDFDKTLRLEPETPPAQEADLRPAEDAISSSDMLDLMEKISQEMEQTKKEPAQPAIEKAPETSVPSSQTVQSAPKISAPETVSIKISAKLVLIPTVLILLGSLVFWSIRSGKLDLPKEWLALKFHKATPAPAAAPPQESQMAAPAPVQKEPAKTGVQDSTPLPEVPQKTVKAKPHKRKVVKVEGTQDPMPPVEEKRTAKTPEEQKELENQKFFLPGVPSPKLSTSKVDTEAPIPKVKPTRKKETPSKTIVQEEVKPSPTKSKSQKRDWTAQSDWGD